MPHISLRDRAGEVVSTQELSARIFAAEINIPLVHQAIVRYQANQRQGTHSTLTRGDVRGTTRKWFRQKGTGRARHGDQRAPIFRGGGVTFGPKPRDYRLEMPRKMRQQAMRVALSAKLESGNLLLIEDLIFEQPRTRDMLTMLNTLVPNWRKVLLVLATPEPNILLSARNLPNVRTAQVGALNIYEVVNAEYIIITRSALAQLEGKLDDGSV